MVSIQDGREKTGIAAFRPFDIDKVDTEQSPSIEARVKRRLDPLY